MQCPVPRQTRLVALVSRGAWSPSSSRCPPPATPCRPPPTPSAPPAPVKQDPRSRDAARPTQVEFINHGKEIKTIYWLNYEGHRVYYTRLQPGDRYIQKTYVCAPLGRDLRRPGHLRNRRAPVRTPSITILN